MATPLPEPLQSFEHAAGGLTAGLGRLDLLRAEYQARHAAGRVLPNSLEALRVELTYHSNAIEGCTLTLRETQLVIEGHTPPGGKPLREIYEARNHDRALRTVEAWASERAAATPLTERDLLDLHAQVLADVDPRGTGRFRTERVLIKGSRFIPPGAHRFAELVPLVLGRANSGAHHAAIDAAELHYNLVAVHPFADGNGRTTRLMMNLFLLRRGYPLTIIEVERRGEYLAALEHANDGRCEPFAEFIAGCVERSTRRLLGP